LQLNQSRSQTIYEIHRKSHILDKSPYSEIEKMLEKSSENIISL